MSSAYSPSSYSLQAKPKVKLYAPARGAVAHPLTISGPVNPLAQTSHVSQHITLPYVIEHIAVHFPPGSDHLVQAYLYLSFDPSSPTDALPTGLSLLSPFSATPYLTGDSQTIDLPMALRVSPRGTWLKLHLVNQDDAPHTITSIWTLLELLED
jgi:hypothetical protein